MKKTHIIYTLSIIIYILSFFVFNDLIIDRIVLLEKYSFISNIKYSNFYLDIYFFTILNFIFIKKIYKKTNYILLLIAIISIGKGFLEYHMINHFINYAIFINGIFAMINVIFLIANKKNLFNFEN